MAGRAIAFGRSALFRHPSFWAEEEPEQLCNQILEDPRVISSEQAVFHGLASQVTPFVASLDEATVNVGCCSMVGGQPKELFKRLLAETHEHPPEFGWRDRRAAYKQCGRLALGADRLVREDDTEASVQRITRRLLVARLDTAPALQPTLGNNSQFEAASLALWGTAAYHPMLRQLAVSYMRTHPEEYAWYLGRNFDAYLAGMACPGTPADELTLRAMADRLGVPFMLVTGDEFVWCVRYPPRQTLSQREVCLAAVAPCSYAMVRRQSALTTLRLGLSNTNGLKIRRRLSEDTHTEDVNPLGAAMQQL